MSAQELSDKLGGELSRGVIANIESGRKTDVTVDQLLTLAWALGVPPVVLAIPIDRPYSWIPIIRGNQRWEWLRAVEVLNWLTYSPDPFRKDRQLATTEAGAVARNQLRVLKELAVVANDLNRAQALSREDPEGYGDLYRDRQTEMDAVLAEALDLGIDPTTFALHPPEEQAKTFGFDAIDPERLDRENWHINSNISHEAASTAMLRMMPHG